LVIGLDNNGSMMDQKLTALTDRLKSAFGDRLVSVVLYGSAAVGDYVARTSDLNILCVLAEITPHELVQSEPVVRWWREQGNPPPLLLSEEEVSTSTDSFPMEFHDIQEHRRVLFGKDVIANLSIDRSFYRAQVEHELRAKQIRLRQKAAEALSSPERLVNLLMESVSTFCVLGRHALLLSGNPPRWKKTEIVAALEDATRRSFGATNEILAMRAAPKQKRTGDFTALFGAYLKEIDSLVRFVDGLER
jgi:predicted nucleotidyltransferase